MKEVKGTTSVCGVIGNPVAHTISPTIHNNLAELTGDELVYVPFHVHTGDLEAAIKGALGLDILGLNITVPYKGDVIPFLSDIDPLAKNIGAVNTLVRTEGGFKGYNTDMPGLLRELQNVGVTVKGEQVLILGAGGVARAVAMLLAKEEASEVIILNRTVEKAQAIATEVNAIAGRELVRTLALTDFGSLPSDKKYVCIQATNVGMHPKTDECVIEDEAFFAKIHTGVDLIYNPLETRFMTKVMAAGGKAYNGLRMLLYQGVIAYELWTGKAVSEEMCEVVYKKMLEAFHE